MPANGDLTLAIRELQERGGHGTRFVDLAIVIQASDGRDLLRVGGVWDRRERGWALDRVPTTARIIQAHAGQDEYLAWWAGWLRGYVTGQWPAGERRAWSSVLYGGRRGGKSIAVMVALCSFAVASRNRVCLALAVADAAAEELHKAIRAILSRQWYGYNSEAGEYTLCNGSVIRINGAGMRSAGKEGRIDLTVLNEAQRIKHDVYLNCRGAAMDSGGVVLLACNPPAQADSGWWVEDHWRRICDGVVAGVQHKVDNRRNSYIPDIATRLDEMAAEMDELTFRREIDGEMGLPPPDAVFYSWSDTDNVKPVPAGWLDCTGEVTKALIGRDFRTVIGQDFDLAAPKMSAMLRAYCPPETPVDERPDACGWWVIDSLKAPDMHESEVVDAHLAMGYGPEDTLVIGDSSGAYQAAEHDGGPVSFVWWRDAGYTIVSAGLVSDQSTTGRARNPRRAARIPLTRSFIRRADGTRRLFVVPGERTAWVVESMRRWPSGDRGTGVTKSEYAHMCDAVSYPLWRLYANRLSKRARAAAAEQRRKAGAGGGGAAPARRERRPRRRA